MSSVCLETVFSVGTLCLIYIYFFCALYIKVSLQRFVLISAWCSNNFISIISFLWIFQLWLSLLANYWLHTHWLLRFRVSIFHWMVCLEILDPLHERHSNQGSHFLPFLFLFVSKPQLLAFKTYILCDVFINNVPSIFALQMF